MENINVKELRVSYIGNSTKVEHIPTGITVTESTTNSKQLNYIRALPILGKRLENHYSIPLRKAC